MDIFQKSIVFAFTPILLFIFLLHYYAVGQAVYGDGIYYFAYTHSLYKDHDLNFHNELGHFYSPQSNNALREEPLEPQKNITKTRLVANKYSIGAPLLWLPAYAVADGIANVTNNFHPTSTIGYGDYYQIAIGILNILFIIIGCFILYKTLNKFFTPLICFLTVTTFLFGSNLLYYGSIDVVNSHPSSFLFSVLFFSIWIGTLSQRTIKQWFLLGCIFGVIILIRTQDIAFVVLLIAEQVSLLRQQKNEMPQQLKKYTIFVVGAFLFFLPQMISWQIIYGDFWHSPYISSQEGFNFLQPHILGVLFNLKTGLVFFTPLFVVSIFGLLFTLRTKKVKVIGVLSLLLALTEIYLISSWSGWTQGESFGMRMMISSIPFLSFGLATLYTRIQRKFKNIGLITVTSLFIVVNFGLILYFMLFSKALTYIGSEPTHLHSLQKLKKLLRL